MTPGVLIVTARPTSEAEVDDFHRWYDETHVPEILAMDGFVAARRYTALDGGDFVTLYEVDDVETAQASFAAAREAGTMSAPVAVRLDPPPTVRWCAELPHR